MPFSGYVPRRRKQNKTKEDLDKLSFVGRKNGGLAEKPARAAIPAKLGIGRDQGSGGGGVGLIDYEKMTVTSSDGIFVFEVMADKSLL